MGEVLKDNLPKGRPREKCDVMSHFPKLDEAGISRKMSSRVQAIAEVPEEEFEETIQTKTPVEANGVT